MGTPGHVATCQCVDCIPPQASVAVSFPCICDQCRSTYLDTSGRCLSCGVGYAPIVPRADFVEALALLREHTQVFDSRIGGYFCAECHREYQHRDDCRLSAFLKKHGEKK